MPFGMDDYQLTDDDVPDGWYENDLHLAAELGKTLLDRNKDLEASLLDTQQQNEEQVMQIVYLEKQLHILRDVTESKSHIYEQLDISSQELDAENQQLKHDLKTAQQRVLRMTETVENLELQVHDQGSTIEQLRTADRERLRERRRLERVHDAMVTNGWGGLPLRRAHSYDLGKPSVDSLYEEELSNLQLSNRNLKQELALKEQKKDELESELAVLVRENKAFENRNRELQVKSRMFEIKRDYRSLDNLNETVCKYCDSVMTLGSDEKSDDSEKMSESKNDRELKRCSSLDLRPIAEELSQEPKYPLPNHDLVQSDGVSLLGEIDAQYHNLMDKYTTLLTRSRSASFHESSSKPRTNSLRRKADSASSQDGGDLSSSPTKASSMSLPGSCPPSSTSSSTSSKQETPPCPVDNHFETGPPEYKALFKRIYEVLHRPLKKTKSKSKLEKS
ncbi:cerebellar degeneration-related protein 2-like [Strongylocentrotus purpuratus]|uniref:Cerebellar degeneration-related protein 2-like n=1 Tax=Strongylocentrotus purpuratus TaxID=7668 RepID=A0A7M7NRE1_STRPU|nr:cerebellar degeneration-related protein 2-like [Strongylocentrotus purpuratus]